MPVTPTPIKPPVLATGFDTGRSSSDGITSINTPTIVGTALPDALVTLYDTDGTTVLGQATAAANGGYSINLAAQLVADLPLNAEQTVIDNVSLDDGDGVHKLTVTAMVPGSSPSGPSQPLILTIDTQKPDAPTAPELTAASDTGSSALDGITSATTLTLTGQSEPNAIVQLFDNGAASAVAQTVAVADGSYSITIATTAGAHSFTVMATDTAGNFSAVSGATAVTIDTTAPAVPPAPTLSAASDTGALRTDGTTNDTTPVIVGTAEAGATVTLTDDDGTVLGHATAGTDGSYAITSSTLLAGPHALTVTATDAAGNVSAVSAPLNILVDTAEATATSTVESAPDSASSVTFTVHFNQPIFDRRGVSPADFQLVTTGSAFGDIEQVSGSGQNGVITVDGLGGSGTIGLSFAAGSEITDAAGNPVVLTSAVTHDVENTTAGDLEPVSAGPSGVVGSGQDPSPSASGRYVAFDSSFDSTGQSNVYVKNMQTGGLTRVSVGLDGDGTNGDSTLPALSANGSVIVFNSTASSLVPGLQELGLNQTNVYVADLTPADPASGDSVEVGLIQLVSSGNGGLGSDSDVAPVVSGDGSTIAFSSSVSLLPGVESGVENVYTYDDSSGELTLITAGTGMDEYGYIPEPENYFGGTTPVFAAIANRPAGQGGDFDSEVTSISADGSEIAFESFATDLGSGPLPTLDPTDLGPPERSYVYDTRTGQITVLDGNGTFFGFVDFNAYSTYRPELSADGTEVTYTVQYGSSSQVIFERNLVTGAVTQLTPGALPSGFGEMDDEATPSAAGTYVAYVQNAEGVVPSEPADLITVIPASAPASVNQIFDGFQPVIAANANTVTFTAPLGTGYAVYQVSLGVTAGIDPIGTADEIDADQFAAITAGGTLTVTGDTNASVGSSVLLQLGALPGTPGPVLTGSVVSPGEWVVAVPAAELSADGDYLAAVTVAAAAGQSARVTRAFTIDTVAPATPGAPALDAGSDTGLAHDGTITDTDTPTVTGTAESGATVTLVDLGGLTPGLVLGTGTADGNGVYAIASLPLTQGAHELAVTAADTAGNVSAASAPLALTVDTIVPDAPGAPDIKPDKPGVPPTFVANPSGDGLISNVTTPTLIGTAIPGTQVTLYDTDGIAVLGTATADAKGQYSITSGTLSDGVHQVTVTATDPAGNVSAASPALDLTVDTLPPLSPVITSLSGPVTAKAEHTLQVDVNGTAEPNSTVALHVDGDPIFVSGTATVDPEGNYTIDGLVAAGVHKLTVIATDAAGNASQPSPVTLVTVDDASIPVITAPPGTVLVTGKAGDGYIAGGEVTADLNGDGAYEPGEPIALTGQDGSFALFGAGGATLILTGGEDTSTGLSMPGPLTAPASSATSAMISPLTTFLTDQMALTGADLSDATGATDVALGFDPSTQLTDLDPIATAQGGVADYERVSAALVDTAVLAAMVIATAANAQTGVQTKAFDATFDAAVRAGEGTAPLDLASATVITGILTDAAAQADPGLVLSDAVLNSAAQIIAAGNAAIDAAGGGGTQVLSTVVAVQKVEQGEAASALGFNDPALLPATVATYTGSALTAAVAAAETEGALPAPRLTDASDTGYSHDDDVTTDNTPTFTGTAVPGTTVLIEVDEAQVFGQEVALIEGIGTADASGRYEIPTEPLHNDLADSHLYAIFATPAASQAQAVLDSQTGVPLAVNETFVDEDLIPDSPEIVGAVNEAAPGNDAADTSLLVYGSSTLGEFVSYAATINVFADGNPDPIGTGSVLQGNSVDSSFDVRTVPLSAGNHVLTITETLPSGAVDVSPSFSVLVTPQSSVSGLAAGSGAFAGADVFYLSNTELLASVGHQAALGGTYVGNVAPGTYPGREDGDSWASTGGDGGFTLPAADATDALIGLDGGWDMLTGLPLGGGTPEAANLGIEPVLVAPAGASVIDPLTSVVAETSPGVFNLSAEAETDASQARVLAALGLAPTLDLVSLDPLTEALAGDPSIFVTDAKLLDTVTLLQQLDGFTFAPIAAAIEQTGSIDLDDPNAIYGMLRMTQSFEVSTADLQTLATLVAASNAAIDAHAQTATGLNDLLSYTLAVERVAQTTETAAVIQAYGQVIYLERQTGTGAAVTSLETGLLSSFTGANLNTAINAALAQAAQVTSFGPTGPEATNAPEVTYELTFTQPVFGLSTGAFSVDEGGDLTGATVTGVTPVAGSGDTAYDVTARTGTGQGELALTWSGTGLTSVDGRPATSGGFESPLFIPTGQDAMGVDSIALGDFNGDGLPDIIESDAGDNLSLGAFLPTVAVLLNEGGGVFVPANLGVSTEIDVTDIAVGDFNGDGKLDAITLGISDSREIGNLPSGNLALLPGNGDGTFRAAITLSGGAAATRLAVGDLNGDGKLDIITNGGAAGNLTLLLGNGDGTFQAPLTIVLPAPDQPADVAVVDLNGDGNPDIIASDEVNGTLEILLGNGDGTFRAASVAAVPIGTGEPIVTDFYGAPTRSVDESDSIAAGDINGDGIPDLVTVNPTDRTVVVLLGDGEGGFTRAAGFAFPTGPAPADFENQSETELQGDSFLQSFVPSTVTVADMNNDGHADLVVGNGAFGNLVLLGNGDGTFIAGAQESTVTGIAELQDTPAIFNRPTATTAADLDDDGRTDLVTAGFSVSDLGSLDQTYGVDVLLSAPPEVLPATSTPVTLTRSPTAQVTLTAVGRMGGLVQNDGTYTLNLGDLTEGATPSALQFSLSNVAEAPSDALDGTFGAPAGTGFTVAGASLPAALEAGQSYQGLTLTPDTSSTGSHTETIEFAPRDLSDIVTTFASETDSDQTVSTSASVDGADVAAELPLVTLQVTDDILPGPPAAALGAASTVVLPNVQIGAADEQAITITNTAASGAANLNVTATASGDAVVAGSITALVPATSDSSSIIAGLDTTGAGSREGTVTLAGTSIGSGVTTVALDSPVGIVVSGDVFRLAAGTIAAITDFVHVGDPGTVALSVSNTAAADGFSENLLASLAGVSGGLSIAAAGPSGEIAAGNSDTTSLQLGFATSSAGTIAGTATVDLTSDGGTGSGSIDGLGTTSLGAVTVPVNVTVDNYATAAISSASTLLTQTGPDSYLLNFGTVELGTSPAAVTLAVGNNASGPADALDGAFSVTGPDDFNISGVGPFTTLAAGSSLTAGTIQPKTFATGPSSETITLTPTDDNGAGFTLAQTPVTVTVEDDVAASDIFTLTGVPATLSTTDTASITPFANVNVSDSAGASFDAFVVVQQPGNGILVSPDLTGVSTDGSTFVFGGTAAQIQAALRSLVFQPAVQPSGAPSVTTGLSIELEQDPAGVVTAGMVTAQTAVTATSVVDPLAITVPPVGLPRVLSGSSSFFAAFAGVTITDDNPGAQDTTTIVLAANGAASDADGTLSGTGLSKTGVGTYVLAAATPAAEQVALQALLFTIPTGTDRTTMSLLVSDGIAPDASAQTMVTTALNASTATVVSTSNPLVATYVDIPVSQTVQVYSTTIQASLGGTVVYNQTFTLPYNDPAVQAAVAQADSDLAAQVASPGQPVLAASSSSSGVTASTTPGGTEIATGTDTTVTTFGPALLGPFDVVAIPGAPVLPGVLPVVTGETNIDVVIPSELTNTQTVTTTTTNLLTQTFTIAGTQFRHAAGSITPVVDYVHVGDPGTVALNVSNAAAADGFSENLLASLAGVTSGLSIAAAGPTGEIAAAGSDASSLQLGFATSSAGTISGSATVDLTSDGGTGSGSIDGLGTTALSPQTVPVSVTVDNFANPVFEDVSGPGTFTPGVAAYTLNLGTIAEGTGPLVVDLGVLNNTTGPSDVATGSLSAIGSSSFTNSGLASIGTLSAGQSDIAPEITLATGTTGVFSETITLTGTGSNPGGFSAALPAETLTVTGSIAALLIPPADPDILNGGSINFANVHVGAATSETLDISNAAAGTAAALDASVQSVTGAATANGSFTGLAPGAENTTSITAGIDTGTAGVQTGTASLAFVSDGGTLGSATLPAQDVTLSGTVYREAAAALLPLNAIVHVGDPGTISLPISNGDPADGFSENLIAMLIGTTGSLGIATAGPTADIAAGETNTNTLALSFATTQAGTISGSAMVGLTSDGAGIDGLGQTTLAAQTVPVTITVDNLATVALSSDGSLISTGPDSYVLNLGTATQGAAALSADLNLGNTATGPADFLDGSFNATGSGQFNNAGLGSVSTITAGTSADAGNVTLSTTQTGVFSETIMLSPTDANADGFSDALTARSITVTGTIVPSTGTSEGDVHMVTYDGLHYDFQAVGDYVLTRSTVPGDTFQIQIETAADPSIAAVSITTEVAARVGSDVVTFGFNQVSVDGAPDTALSTTDPLQDLAGGQLQELSPTEFRLTWASGEVLTVTNAGSYLNTAVSLPKTDGPGSVQGLLGSDSGLANDFALPNGTVLRQPLSGAELLGAFANAWQSNSLLTGVSPMQFIYTDGTTGQAVAQATAAGQVLTAEPNVNVLSDTGGFGVTFLGTLAELANETITGFSAKDVIDVSDLNSATTAVSFEGTNGGGVLSLSDGTQHGNLQLSGQINGGFKVMPDNHGGSFITIT